MALIIYKQRHHNSNYPSSAQSNYNYVRYIAIREGVLTTENHDHGLFGKLEVGPLQNFLTFEEVAKKVYQNTKDRITMYQGIVSFKQETAEEIGLTSLEAWQRYIEKHIFTLAEKNKIPISRLQWAAAVHDADGHPHTHITFWDRNPEFQRSFVKPEIPKSIWQTLTKDTFGDRIFEVGKAKDALAKKVRADTALLTEDFNEAVSLLGKSRYEVIRDVYQRGLGEYPFNFHPQILNEIAPDIFRLKENVPKSGRLNYQLLPQEMKSLVDKIVFDILNHSPDIAQCYEDYVAIKVKQASFYKKITEEMETKYRKEAEKMIATGVMNMVRGLGQLEWQYQKESYEEREWFFLMDQLLQSLYELFQNQGDSSSQNKQTIRGELSAEAKKEYALRKQDKGYEH